jgi:hypothetical protein
MQALERGRYAKLKKILAQIFTGQAVLPAPRGLPFADASIGDIFPRPA